MKLLSRVARLEDLFPKPPGPCPRCGGIKEGGSGVFYAGFIVSMDDPEKPDLTWCMCKHCHRRFTCRAERLREYVLLVKEAHFKRPYCRGDPPDDDLI